MAPGIRLVVGLGNPGSRYAQTPHNIGFDVLEALAAREKLRFRRGFLLRGWVSTWQREPSPVFLLKPRTFMNRSGESVVRALRRWGLRPEEMLLVYDDLELPLGRLRLRKQGGAGGHNGVSSVIAALGGEKDFPRLRVGVGPRPAGDSLVEYVLGPWPATAMDQVSGATTRAVEAVSRALRDGVDAAMNEFNAG
jgi:PTH1 family peptidyl-tRNA hydrolase